VFTVYFEKVGFNHICGITILNATTSKTKHII